jgi:hypothetical protein
MSNTNKLTDAVQPSLTKIKLTPKRSFKSPLKGLPYALKNNSRYGFLYKKHLCVQERTYVSDKTMLGYPNYNPPNLIFSPRGIHGRPRMYLMYCGINATEIFYPKHS